jgi:hypothetical protein
MVTNELKFTVRGGFSAQRMHLHNELGDFAS